MNNNKINRKTTPANQPKEALPTSKISTTNESTSPRSKSSTNIQSLLPKIGKTKETQSEQLIKLKKGDPWFTKEDYEALQKNPKGEESEEEFQSDKTREEECELDSTVRYWKDKKWGRIILEGGSDLE